MKSGPYPKELCGYEGHVDAVAEWTEDWIGQDAFDRKAATWSEQIGRAIHEESLLLPSMAGNPGGQTADFIVIVQHLVAHGLVEQRGEEGAIEYRWKP